MKHIIWTDGAGRLQITTPAPAAQGEGESEDAFVERIQSKDVPKGISSRIVNTEDLPQSREFRNAWTDTGKEIIVDKSKLEDA